MKILYVTGIYPPAIGGPSAQTKDLVEEMRHRGYEVRVLTVVSSHTSSFPSEAGIKRISTHISGSTGRLAAQARMFSEAYTAVRSFQPDLVHCQTLGYLPMYAAAVARLSGIPVLVKYAADIATDIDAVEARTTRPDARLVARRRFGVFRQRIVFRLANRIWTTTPTYARFVEQAETSRKVLSLPNFAADLSAERPAKTHDTQDPFSLLAVCRIKPLKGLHVALDALAQLDDRFRLTIAGDGDAGYINALRSQAQRLGLADRVTFLGRVPHGEVGSLYARAGMFVMPSLTEAFGITLIEAMTYGVPIVASKVGGIPDVVEQGQSAHLVPSGDPTALADAIRSLAGNSERREALVRAGLRRAKDFDKTRIVRQLVDEYKDLIGLPSYCAGSGN